MMVSLTTARAANAALPKSSPTALFLSATSGTGLGAVEALLRYTTSPHLIIVGRSESRFSPTLARLKTINPEAKLEFLEAQVSLLSEVARVCDIVETKITALDYLWLSQGGLAPASHSMNAEGLNEYLALNFYSRTLFMHRMLPLLNAASSPRVVSVLSAGQEGEVALEDLGLRDPSRYAVFRAMKHTVMMTSLVMKHLARQNPRIAFLHTNPGMVSSDVHNRWIQTMTGPWAVLGWIAKWTVVPFFHSLGYSPEQAGELGFFAMTDKRFAVDGDANFFRINEKAEMETSSAPIMRIAEYQKRGFGEKIWKHSLQVFSNIVDGKI